MNADKAIANFTESPYVGAMMKQPSATRTLARESRQITYTGFLLLIVFTMFFQYIWPFSKALQWGLQSGLIWLWVLSRVHQQLELNRASVQQAVYDHLGWANRLTILRGFLIALCGGFIFQSNLSKIILILPALSYFFAAIIDRIDGYIARKSRQESLLGTKLDIEYDALGLLIAPILAVWIGQIHWTYLSVSLAYYLFQWGLYWRKRQELPVFQLPVNMSRRAIAGFQMGFLAVVLWPILAPPATIVAGAAFMLPLLIGFLIDWLTVSGRLNLDSDKSKAFFAQTHILIHNILLPALRIMILALLLLTLGSNAVFSSLVNGIEFGNLIQIVILLFPALMILFGLNGRLFAVILSCLLAWFYLSYPMQIHDALLLAAVIWIMQLGTGKYSLWLWDDKWVNRYDGA